jgi:hypothetical protein
LLIETYNPTIRVERIAAFPFQQWLCERSTILRYTVSVVLFSSLLHPRKFHNGTWLGRGTRWRSG